MGYADVPMFINDIECNNKFHILPAHTLVAEVNLGKMWQRKHNVHLDWEHDKVYFNIGCQISSVNFAPKYEYQLLVSQEEEDKELEELQLTLLPTICESKPEEGDNQSTSNSRYIKPQKYTQVWVRK